MNRRPLPPVLLLLLFLFPACRGPVPQNTPAAGEPVVIGTLAGGGTVRAVPAGEGRWGIAIEGIGQAAVSQPQPVELEWHLDSADIRRQAHAYGAVQKTPEGLRATARVPLGRAVLAVQDDWAVTGDVVRVARKVTVSGNEAGGLMTALTFRAGPGQTRADTRFFAPGMIYGGSAHLTEVAIGGRQASPTVRIREDRLPAPLFGLHFPDGAALTVLDPAPDGRTTAEDSRDQRARTLVDERFRFGAVGAEEEEGRLRLGFWWPGSEGGTTYSGRTYPGGQLQRWRRRYHPLRDGLVQEYQVAFRVSRGEAFTQYYRNAWRWAWNTLQPKVNHQDIELVRRSMLDMLGQRPVTAPHGKTGIPLFIDATTQQVPAHENRALMGFIGKNLEAAEFLLRDANRTTGPASARHRQVATAIFDSFARLDMAPPKTEGFHLATGEQVATAFANAVFLRSLADDFKATMRTLRHERQAGREHPAWLRWCTAFGDWLLTQQDPDGGFPRSWKSGVGTVLDRSKQSSYNAIPFLTLLSQHTGDGRYLQAAVRAADYLWAHGQAEGVFVGGTIDNPDVIDKEAGTLSLEAYLALHQATGQPQWLERARLAADFAETWMYLWDVPIPADETDPNLHWKQGVPTVGLQLISSGHSLADAYMAFDTDEYARLFLLTQDPHYREVARILLHNTKGMVALPGRLYDLAGPGWQQEHWSLAPMRGFGLHRGWLPWVTTSQLNGIFGLEELDPALFRELAAKPE